MGGLQRYATIIVLMLKLKSYETYLRCFKIHALSSIEEKKIPKV